ncbi:hypothetical protein BJV77DRAFT_958884 [Russula vinacea]|nr:hypothetical protein BJV77DRAFT_958884 [Russula vinacea]
MSHRRNTSTTTAPTRASAGQRSYIVSIDAGAFANVEIVVEGYNRGGVWTSSRTATTVKKTSKSHHVYAYVPTTTTPSIPSTKPTPFSPQPPASARSQSSASDARTKRREKEREYIAAQNRIAAEERAAREQRQRRREDVEARRLAEATRRAAAVAEEARRRRLANNSSNNSGSGSNKHLDELLGPEAIREFLLSPAHSPDVVAKDRIRAALRRWHPDKFARVLSQVVESDKDAVAEGVGIVVRCLNEMLERENHA